ncbi:unnamed protein product [Vitrella brassicaformis CCMP3155]|uniref:Uncharacterized protein n=1 Tax=Vitrella brassicaformis (strain CCMP3155) TaxID=1169540 RepID=A0A0G4ETS2_VITBC|nr:unnamed protein product [Vitrella brassicaformis CCMP3155]|eukprot:CEM01722.1 unnamed protein product [Vitrella brassicaformis CCMP3155]
MDFLLRLLYTIEKSGEWAGWEAIVRVAKHRGLVGRLPIELGSAAVEAVGSRAVYHERCEALRQLSLIGRHLGVALERVDGEERLGRYQVTIRSLQTLPANSPFRNMFDEANPVCHIDGADYASVRSAVLYQMRWGRFVADQTVHQQNNAPSYDRLRQLARQQPPVWHCHTVGTSHNAAGGGRDRMIVLHGDQPFEASIAIISYPDFARAILWTTERQVAGKEGAARIPQTVRVAQRVMGDDAQVAFGNQLDVAIG